MRLEDINGSPYFFCVYALIIGILVDILTLRRIGQAKRGPMLQFGAVGGTLIIAFSIYTSSSTNLHSTPYEPALICVIGFTMKLGSLVSALVGDVSFRRRIG